MKCNNHLSKCTCPDLQERLESLSKVKELHIGPQAKKAYQDQAKRNNEEQVKQE